MPENIDLEPLISIIIPVYNSSRTLFKCVDSIIKQTYSNWEILIVDSDSTDETPSIAKLYRHKLGDKCRYYVIRNRFQAAKRNFGAKEAKGDYLFLLDSDQYLPSTTLEEAVELIRNGVNGLSLPESRVPPRGYLAKSLFFLRDVIYETEAKTIGIPRLIRRDLYFNVGGQDETLNYVEDGDYFFKLQMKGIECGWCKTTILHDENVSFKWIVYKAWYSYPNALRLRKKWRHIFKDIGAINRGARYGSLIIALIKKPIYAFGVIFILFVKMLARRLGFIACKI